MDAGVASATGTGRGEKFFLEICGHVGLSGVIDNIVMKSLSRYGPREFVLKKSDI